MLLLPFLAILMVSCLGNLSGEETLPIPMLADFDTTILSHLKTFCQKELNENEKNIIENAIKEAKDGKEAREVKLTTLNSLLCYSIKTLDIEFLQLGENIMQQMNFANLKTNEKEHSIFTTIQTYIEKHRLPKPTVTPIEHYHEFVTEVGKQIVEIMTDRLYLHIAKTWLSENQVSKTNEFLNSLRLKAKECLLPPVPKPWKNLFIARVQTLKSVKSDPFDPSTYDDESLALAQSTFRMQHAAIEIYINYKFDDAEQQLSFFLDLFVANLIYIEFIQNDKKYLAYTWKMRLTMEPKKRN